MARDVDVVVVASLNLDLVVAADRMPGPGETVSGSSYNEFAGGKGLNQSVAAARSGARVAIVGAVGADHAGDYLRGIVRDEGIDDEKLVTVASEPTGRALITLDATGENSIVVVAGANAAVDVDDLAAAPVVLAQLETGAAAARAAFTMARERGALTVLNPAPAEAMSADLLDLADVVIPNEHEAELLGGREALADRVGHVVITRGAAGADYLANGVTTHIEPVAVDVVDTTGAGDAFCGSFAARLAAGDDIVDALRYSVVAGALATTVSGAVPSQPRAADVQARLALQ